MTISENQPSINESFSENWLATTRKSPSLELIVGDSFRFSIDVSRLHNSSDYFELDLGVLELNRRATPPEALATDQGSDQVAEVGIKGRRRKSLARKWWGLLWKRYVCLVVREVWRVVGVTRSSKVAVNILNYRKAGGEMEKGVCDDWRRSFDSETSICDAVLHCKRSIATT